MRLSFPSTSPSKELTRHPLLSGYISRWAWRVYSQRLTPAGRWLVLLSFLFTAYGAISLRLQGYVLYAYVVALWLIAWLAMLLYRPKVRLRAIFPSRVCAGEVVPVEVELQQLGRLRGADLVILPHRLPAPIDGTPEQTYLPDLKRGQEARLRLHLKCNRRGAYVLRGLRVETGFPFGILRARRIFAQEHPLLVYPQFRPLARLVLPTGRRYQPGGVALASHLGESFEFIGNREYREGDNVRDIDWRATARVMRGGGAFTHPIVREYVEEYMLRVAVILDTHVPKTKRPQPERVEAFERAVSVAASVSDYMARQEYLVDIFAAGPNLYHLTAGRSLAYLDQILDILACVEENPEEPFEVIEPQIGELLSRLSTVICVFLDWNDTRRAFVHRLTAAGAAVKVIILRDEACTLDPRADARTIGLVPLISQADYERGIEQM